MKPILLAVLVVLTLTPLCDAFGFEVAAKSRQCFFEYSEPNSLVGVMFQVTHGGFLDINIQVKGPDEKEIYSGERETEGRYSFNAHASGLYSFCFDNSMSSLTSKVVQLDVTVTPAQQRDAKAAKGDDDDDDPIKQQLELLSSAISGISSDQKYLKMRQKAHKSTNENTNQRVILWGIFEIGVLAVMTIVQVLYLRKFFERVNPI
eukprot:TRINITY_DN13476_c0_g1_i1.p1 TRINITY_DN13476_c0_g1~~TRINITY_DN13476_c0_g1_i1.p1  ORF type:complete len:205 (-),score=39.64 TRINITY_DN13476_c0_g1_i1:78-692(-)